MDNQNLRWRSKHGDNIGKYDERRGRNQIIRSGKFVLQKIAKTRRKSEHIERKNEGFGVSSHPDENHDFRIEMENLSGCIESRV